MLSHAIWAFFKKHSDTKWDNKNIVNQILGGGGTPVAPPSGSATEWLRENRWQKTLQMVVNLIQSHYCQRKHPRKGIVTSRKVWHGLELWINRRNLAPKVLSLQSGNAMLDRHARLSAETIWGWGPVRPHEWFIERADWRNSKNNMERSAKVLWFRMSGNLYGNHSFTTDNISLSRGLHYFFLGRRQ